MITRVETWGIQIPSLFDGGPEGELRPSQSLLRKLPKADLHCHLDGSLRLDTLRHLALENGIELPKTAAELETAIKSGRRCESLADCLRAFAITTSVMQTRDSLVRIARELMEDAARENIAYLEVRFCPSLHTKQGLSPEDVMDAVIHGLATGALEHGLLFGLIICGLRHFSPDENLALAELAARYRTIGHRCVVGFDLAGDENLDGATREPFEAARGGGLGCTIHAGESDTNWSLRKALRLGADRIGHGTKVVEDYRLQRAIMDRRIPLEICLSSNWQTGAVNKIADHPLDTYLAAGVDVTLCTDNRLVAKTTLTREYWLAVNELGLSTRDCLNMILTGFESAFLPADEKLGLMTSVAREINSILREW